MKIWTIVSQKGGEGKTTVANALAVAAHLDGRSVAVFDLDPQVSACKWGDRRNSDPPVIPVVAARLAQSIEAAREHGADLVIIDTPPKAAEAAIAGAAVADLILIPCKAEIKGLETLETTAKLISSTGTKAPVYVLLNDLPPNARLVRREAEESVHDLGLTALPEILTHRADYKKADILGQTPQEYDRKGDAAREIAEVYKFICELLNMKTKQQEKMYAKTNAA